ncbi:hypothetical protein QBZ16_003789 [Prototheca wickerhamii]|uniref:Uncharacterized protein n=1 Tax=Prototheca wickerhamii TaxID=3111 RepID=A0AAD9IHU2_PROWI|nr:hypothetical protein QBZ16_003789 [Prototheca wickerhamii]
MSSTQLEAYRNVLAEENPDLFKWLTNQLPTPEHLQRNEAYRMLYKSVQGTLDENSVVSTRATPGQDWVRGWDDLKRGPLAPSEPAQE